LILNGTETYSFNEFKKKYKGSWKYKCVHCQSVIEVPKEPKGGYYMWEYLCETMSDYAIQMICSEKCIKEVEQIFKQRRGIE